MLARLGNVIYLIACGFAVVVFLAVVKDVPNEQDKVFGFIVAVVAALIIWAVGRGIQYIFGGGRS